MLHGSIIAVVSSVRGSLLPRVVVHEGGINLNRVPQSEECHRKKCPSIVCVALGASLICWKACCPVYLAQLVGRFPSSPSGGLPVSLVEGCICSLYYYALLQGSRRPRGGLLRRPLEPFPGALSPGRVVGYLLGPV